MYAAHDKLSIYATGATREGAIQKARDDAKDDEAQFETSMIAPELAAYIEKHGWDGNAESFDVKCGWITNPEHRGEPIEFMKARA